MRSIMAAAAATGAAGAIAASQTAAPVLLCPAHETVAMADGRLLGHIPYAQAAATDLVAPPAGFGSGNCSQIDREVKVPLAGMIAAATRDDPKVGKAMMGISCFRSIERQRGLFCAPARLAARGIAGQAKWVAPPAFSEHATGFAIDFGDRSRAGCNVSSCFGETRVGKWLAVNARKFGFELSFPNGNKQGVSFEPWHYRWAGSDRARAVFTRARRDFPSP